MSLLVVALLTLPAATSTGDILWQGWDDAVFQRAQAQQRFVLLDLGAAWCHVMEETTYRDPIVVQLVRERFLPVRVDQDQRPDLSNRYEDYGWPATVIFDARGQELAKFSGYIPPPRMRSLLQGVVDDPTPGPSVRPEGQRSAAPETALAESLRRELADLLVSRYDAEHGGWGFAKKFLDWDSVEWSLRRAREGDRDAERRRLGVPRVDTHLYTRENGWAAHALVWFWAVSGDESALADARAAARWIVANRALPDGGYRHDAQDAGGPYMGDTVAAGRAFLSLYSATGEREWLARAEDAARFIGRRFERTASRGSFPRRPRPASLPSHSGTRTC
jgi:uncharacterized protein YyaL (SSP411 family)